MQERVGLIEPDEAVRRQVLRALGDGGLHVEPFEEVAEFMMFRGQSQYAVLVGDERVDALAVRERLVGEGDWAAILAYSEKPDLRRVVRFIRGGGYDYFALPIALPTLSRSLSRLDHGATPYVAARCRAAVAHQRLAALSPREGEVLTAMAQGESNKSIGIDLGISPRTVEIHRANMLSKLGASSSTEAIRMFCEDALLNGAAARPTG